MGEGEGGGRGGREREEGEGGRSGWREEGVSLSLVVLSHVPLYVDEHLLWS